MLKAIKELMLMIDIGLGHYLTLGAIIFTIGEYIFELSIVESTIKDSSLPDLKP